MREVDLNREDFLNLAEDVLKRGGIFWFKALGLSMHPSVRSGDILIVESTRPTEVLIGDVIVFRRAPNHLIAHRVTAKVLKEDTIVFSVRGDNMDCDEPVGESDILGRVVMLKRGNKIVKSLKISNYFQRLLWSKYQAFRRKIADLIIC